VLAVLLALVAVSASTSSSIQAQARSDDSLPLDAWAPLGPLGPDRTGAVGVSAEWPADPFLIVSLSGPYDAGSGQRPPPTAPAARSYDAGQTWEPLSSPPPAGQLTVITTESYGRVLFALPRREEERAEQSVFRSTDDGLTWSSVAPTNRGARLVVSPDVRHDHQLLLVSGGTVQRSLDAGASWSALDPSPGQLVQDAVFSPSFSTDRTILLVATAGGYPSLTSPGDRDVAAYGERSAGILVSMDGGASWQPSTSGLELEGAPFRHVQALAISPTFARDGTLFAFAWGALGATSDTGGLVVGVTGALFRSRDRGASWQMVKPPQDRASIGRAGRATRLFAAVAVAPDFADSGLALMTLSRDGGSPASGSCSLDWTVDGGDTWSSRAEETSYGGCGTVRFGGGPHTAMWTTYSSGGGGWRMTRDGGVTEAPFAIFDPAGGPEAPAAVGQDGTLLAIGPSGLWALGPSAVRTDGRLPCAIQEAGAYLAAWLASPRARTALGCPIGEPRAVTVRERRVGDVRNLWLDDESTDWLSLEPLKRTSSGSGRALRQSKTATPWTGPPDRLVEAEVQPYVGGRIMRLPEPDGRRILLVLGSSWELVPEEPSP
jgi:hypothetical protein